jgi:hypothetical protein
MRCTVAPPRQTRLKWFIDFINSRPADSTDDECLRIAAELAMHCDWVLVEFDDLDEAPETDSNVDSPDSSSKVSEGYLKDYAQRIHGHRPRNPEYYAKEAVFWVGWYAGSTILKQVAEELAVLHKSLRAFFLEGLIPRLKETRGYWERLRDINGTYCFEFDDPLSMDTRESTVRIHTRIGLLSSLAPRNSRGQIDFEKGRHGPISLETLPFEMTIIPPVSPEGVIFKFLEALTGSCMSDLGECEECENWFVRTSKREKRFCSHGCSSRNHSRLKIKALKEAHSEEYSKELAEGRERAHRSYVRKAKKKHGSKVKVTRRPRNGKDKEA